MTFTGPSPKFDLGLAGSVDVATAAPWFPALPPGSGPLELTGRATGPLNDPEFAYSVRSTGVTLPDITVPASEAGGRISRRGIFVDRMRTGIGRGAIEAAGRLPLGADDPTSRFSLTWVDVPVAELTKLFAGMPADPIGLVTTGSARIRWPETAMRFETIEGDVDAAVRAAPSLPAAAFRAMAQSGRWTIRGEQDLDGGTRAVLDGTLTVDASSFADSGIDGTVQVTGDDVVGALTGLRRGFPSLPDVGGVLSASPLTADTRIGGTVGSPVITGSAASDALRVYALPPMRAAAEFEATISTLTVTKASGHDEAGNRIEGRAAFDFGSGTTRGAFTAGVANLEPVLFCLS